ncbi:Uncharacterised protein [Shigella sonnei]|nr:Uncharacterised protein [Shigella sonnei]
MFALVCQRTLRLGRIERNCSEIAKVKSQTKHGGTVIFSILSTTIPCRSPRSAPLQRGLGKFALLLFITIGSVFRQCHRVFDSPLTLE